jgi:hypothetical protein
MNIPLTRDEWYKLRDDRTNRITKVDFDNHTVGILLDQDHKKSFSHQCMAYITCNIMSRWCRRLVIDLPDVENILPNQCDQNFKGLIKKSTSSIDPFGDFRFDKIDDKKVDQILVIGNHEKTYSKPTVWIDANGWIAGCGTDSNKPKFVNNKHNHNPIGPSFASCFGVAQIFQQFVDGNTNTEYQKWLSLFDFKTGDPSRLQNPDFFADFDYGTIYQIGCGAVGSSLDTLISLTDWKINLGLIDHDVVSYTNCNRSLPFSPYDALQKKFKVDVCSNILQNNNRSIFTIPKTYYEFTGDGLFQKLRPDLILSLANEYNVWSTIQDNYPPIVIHAATTQNWGVNLGRHIPNSEWCIMCTFSKFLNNSYRPRCDTGKITSENSTPIFGVLPFLSPAAATLVLAELSKLPFENYPINSNFIDFSIKSPFNFLLSQRRPKKECMCSEQKPGIYDELRGDSKFWRFCEC